MKKVQNVRTKSALTPFLNSIKTKIRMKKELSQ